MIELYLAENEFYLNGTMKYNYEELHQKLVKEDINYKLNLYLIAPIVWSFLILVGLTGNGMVLYLMIKRNLTKNSCTNCYITNVCLADSVFITLIVSASIPAYLFQEWIFGGMMCHILNFLISSSVQASCLTLTAMTIDRYLAILYPFKSIQFRTTKTAYLMSISIWISSCIMCIPSMIYNELIVYDIPVRFNTISSNQTIQIMTHNTTLTRKQCHTQFPNYKIDKIFTMYTIFISYLLPVLIISICYTRMAIKFLFNKRISKNSSTIIQTNNDKYQPMVFYGNKKRFQRHSVDVGNSMGFCLSADDSKLNVNFNDFCGLNKERKKSGRDNIRLNSQRISKKTQNQKGSSQKHFSGSYRKRKTLILIIIICISFIILWLPINIINFWKVFYPNKFPYTNQMYIIKFVSHTLSYVNSCLNPFLYALMGAKFRNYILIEYQLLKKRLKI